MRIIFDPTSLHQSRMGAVTGVVYFDFGSDQHFPVKGWNDFVVVIAGWWLAAVEEISRGSRETKLRFMDGPYWITIIAEPDGSVTLRCTEDRKGADVIGEQIATLDALRSELQSFANRVLRGCVDRAIESPDLDTVRSYLLN